jgi:outer membrane protein assembly factor BamE (lipoprotein component of BamABCDE complex)
MIRRAAILCCVCLAGAGIPLSACTSTSKAPAAQDDPNTLTHGAVQLTLKTGQTTRTEVLEAFGAPNITTLDASGREVWTYRRHATVTRASGNDSYFNILIFGTGGTSGEQSSSSRTMTLIIKFDENGVVHDFRSMSSSF